MVGCSWRESFGMDCLTCGFQRSVELLLRGEMWESIRIFPATIPFLLTVLLLLLHLWKKYTHGGKIIVGLYAVTAALIVLNYSLKLVHGSFVH